MPKRSAGLLPYRNGVSGWEVFLVHPGGPFWAKKEAGAWSIPKGEYSEPEDPLSAARREFTEETGFHAAGPFIDLGEIRQASGKLVRCWAVAADFDPAAIVSNRFSMEWPPKSRRMQEFPEVDRAAWFSWAEAQEKLVPGQVELLTRLQRFV